MGDLRQRLFKKVISIYLTVPIIIPDNMHFCHVRINCYNVITIWKTSKQNQNKLTKTSQQNKTIQCLVLYKVLGHMIQRICSQVFSVGVLLLRMHRYDHMYTYTSIMHKKAKLPF